MARTASTMVPLGTAAHPFDLPDPFGNVVWFDDLSKGKLLLVMFISNHCPYVKHVAHELAAIGREYQPRGVAMVAINSNDAEAYPDDAPDKMLDEVRRRGYTFPYVFDEDQVVAETYRAACTPDFFLFDAERKLIYRGQLDDSRPGTDTPVTGRDLRAALEAALAGAPIAADQKPSLGCNIKWKPGHEPAWLNQL